jgi:hypothetical protein
MLLGFLMIQNSDSFAQYGGGGIVNQFQGPVDDGDVGQKLIRLDLNATGALGPPSCTQLSFNLIGFNSIQTAYLYTTDQTPTFTGARLLSTVNLPGALLTFNGFTENDAAAGFHYYWVLFDAKATVVPGTQIDASYNTGFFSLPSPTVATPNPSGFRFTSRNYKIGNTVAEQYATLGAVATAISQFDYDGGADIFFEFTANYLNPAETAMSFSNHFGPADIYVRPELGRTAVVTAGVMAAGATFINFSDVRKLNFDGRPGGVGVIKEWTIRNNLTGASVGPGLSLTNDAISNSFKYIIFEGETDALNGIIYFGSSAGPSGNDNNIISDCFIRDLTVGGTVTKPAKGILSSGSAGRTNSGNTIDNCHFIDIFNGASPASSSIMLNSNSDSWNITNNHFYQAASVSNCNNQTAFITILTGAGHIVTGNAMGGTAANAGGAPYNITSGTNQFIAIRANGTGSPITINKNIIANLVYTTTSVLATHPLVGIQLEGVPDYTVGASGNGNTIGSMTTTGNITLTNNGANTSLGFTAIKNNGTGANISIAYNSIGGITLNGTRTGASSVGIMHNSGTAAIDNNTIGGAIASSITITSNSSLFLIQNGSATGLTCTNNVLQNVAHNATTAIFGGIYNPVGPLTCTGNTLQNIATPGTSGGSFFMIDHQPVPSAIATISNNTIQSITLSNATATPVFYGISINTDLAVTCNNNTIGSTVNNNMSFANNSGVYPIYKSLTGALTLQNNLIQEFNLTNTGATCQFYGINCVGGSMNASTNIIRNIDLAGTAAQRIISNTGTAATLTGNTIELINTTSAANSILYGMYNSSASGMSCINNTFQNFSHIASSQILSLINNSAGPLTATGNLFTNITTSSSGGAGGNGGNTIISNWLGGLGTINTNTIQNITLSSAVSRLFVIELNSTSATTVDGNTIGGTTASNISLAGNGDQQMIYKTGTGSLSVTNNVFQNIRLSSGGANTGFEAILASQGSFTCTGNTIQNVSINTTSTADFAAIWSSTASAGVIISNNIINNINLTNATAVANRNEGIYVTNGSGTISKNFLGQLSNASTSATAKVVALEVFNGSWNCSNNVILLDNNAATNSVAIYGIECPSIGTVNIWHNTVKIYGSQAAGTSFTAAIYRTGGGTYAVRNNIFQNLRTGGTGGHFAEFSSVNTGTYASNYNYLEASTPAALCKLVATTYNLVGWQGIIPAPNSISGTTTIDANGYALTPFVGAGAGTNLFASVPDDKVGAARSTTPWMGAFEGAGINTSAIAPLSYCPGATVNVPYTITGTFVAGNIFTAQLSDAAGSFAAPTSIGTLTSVAAGTIAATIPGAQALGAAYRIRVVSSDPIVTGSDNGANIAISGPAIFTVINTNDAGAGSLRQAIIDANANCGHDTIKFNLGAGGPYTITLATALPNLTDNAGATIHGFSQTGASPNTIPVFNTTGATPMNPVYKIILANSGVVPTALVLASDSNIVKGLVLQDFGDGTPSANDIAITVTGNNNKVLGCYIGMDITGTVKGTKTAIGIQISGASNAVGDGTAAGANLISGLNGSLQGINITSATAIGNSVKGNMIGLQKDGTTRVAGIAQSMGILLNTTAGGNNIIGGSAAGEGNVLSGNSTYGIRSSCTAISGNSIIGNIIGPQANGNTFVTGNTQTYGIYLISSRNNIIGGNTSAHRNIVSANQFAGFNITGAGTTGNLIKGNYIGIAKNGTSFITGSTQPFGVYMENLAGGNIIGGSAAGEGNVISGNSGNPGYGINSSSTAGNTITGNIIGPQADGTTYLAANNQSYGIYFQGAANHIVGGNTALTRNIISANEIAGVYITGASATGNVVKGNYIGLDSSGTTFIAGSSQNFGVYITTSAAANTIGGTAAGEGNVISGNNDGAATGKGIYINSTAANGNSVIGNIIGPQKNGASFVTGNLQMYGITLDNSRNNIIGSSTPGAKNTISANQSYGIYILTAGATGNSIKGNYIGIDITGTTFITGSAQYCGVYTDFGAGINTIGGTVSGEGNVISGNASRGIEIAATSGGSSVIGNIIGPQADGLTYLASNDQDYGVFINGSPGNIIGVAGGGNTISANEIYGIYLTQPGCANNLIKGNYIGINKTGTSFITGSAQDCGLLFETTCGGNNIIGGSAAGEGNVISANKQSVGTGFGIFMSATTAAGNSILGNIIGPQADGFSYIASNPQTNGIYITASPNNIIGTGAAGSRNIISANEVYAIVITGATSTGNSIRGNYIGPGTGMVKITGAAQDYGIRILNGGSNSIIGGVISGQENQIVYNTTNGIFINSLTSTGNLITRNPIYSNTGKPINLTYGASQGNNGMAFPVITTANITTVSGTAPANSTVEVFNSPTSASCFDAQVYLGTAVANGAGNWTLATALTAGDTVVANATDASNNTSEFSSCVPILGAQTISTSAIAPTLLCRGGTVSVSYTITGTFNAGNIFTAQLSDAAGSFAAPVAIGTLASTVAGTITATIPAGAATGAAYRIRVVASNPVTTGTDNGANLTVPANGGAGTWTWTGAVSASWFDPCNWDKKCLPDLSSDVIIPGATPFNPLITGSTGSCRTIQIQFAAGANVTIDTTASGQLQVAQ